MLRLHHAQRKRVVAVFAVIHITQVDLVFARKEEFVRLRKNGERARACIQNFKPIARLEVDRLLIQVATELVLLPQLRIVAPLELGVFADREALQAGFVNVGHIFGIGFGHRLLAQQVRALVRSEFQIARKKAQRQAVEHHAHAVAVAFHTARVGVVTHRGALHLIGGAARTHQMRVVAGNLQGRIPENIPFVFFLGLRRVLIEVLQNIELGRRNAATASGHLKIRLEIFAQHNPRAAGFFGSQLLNHRLSIAQRKPRTVLLAVFARPNDLNAAAALGHAHAGDRPPVLHVATLRLRHGRARAQHHHPRHPTESHWHLLCSLAMVLRSRFFVRATPRAAHHIFTKIFLR